MKNKTRIPRQNRGVRTREKIIIAALELFSEKGYHSTNSKEIAARADVSIGSLYAYFKDKKDLFIEACKYYDSYIENELYMNVSGSSSEQKSFNGWENLWKDFSSCRDNREKIKIILMNLMESRNYYPGFLREMNVMRLLDPEIKQIIDDHERSDISNLADLINSFGAESRVKDADVAAYIIFRAIETTIYETKLVPSMPDIHERLINEMTDIIYRYLFHN